MNLRRVLFIWEVKVFYGLVEPYSNETIELRNKPVSNLQARCWRQLE